MLRFSIIIPNYNYADFVGSAIESALAVDWPAVEVIVVDDGSTDGSREAIARYADRVTVVEQANAGQRAACNSGFAVSTGDAVLFLDSDDVVEPQLARRVAEVWSRGLSKVQVQMRRILHDGTPTAAVFPRFDRCPDPREIRRWALRTSAYPTPPGSGNLYARSFLEKVMPIGPEADRFIDSPLLAAAPYFGRVMTICEPLVGYRIHGANDSDLLADGSRFGREVERALRRYMFAQSRRNPGREVDLAPLYRSRELFQFRVAARRVGDTSPALPGDSLARLLAGLASFPFHPGPEGLRMRLMTWGWSAAMLVAPRRLTPILLEKRFRRH